MVPHGMGGVGRAQTLQGFVGDERPLGFLLRAMRCILGIARFYFYFANIPMATTWRTD